MQTVSIPERMPGMGDRVRFRNSYVPACGIIVDELTESYVLVKWDGVATPTPHWREDLQIDTRVEPPVQ